MKIVGISGSLRKDSYNTKLLKEIGKNVDFEILDLFGIPLFSEDLESSVPQVVTDLKDKIDASDIVVIATPEYNYSVSGVLKNALDWFSRGDKKVFDGKKVAIISASISRFGGVRAQSHLRQILLGMGAIVMNKPEIFIAEAHDKLNDPIDQKAKESIEKFTKKIFEL